MLRKHIKRQFDRIVYSSPPLNKVLRNINKAARSLTRFRLRPYGIIRVRYKNVSFRMATNETSFVTKHLFWDGPENFEYTPIFEPLIRECRVFIDVGANSGYYSLLAAAANPNITVHAFEPASGPYHFLVQNIQLNGVADRVQAYEIALSNQAGEVEFFEMINPEGTFARHNLSGVGGLKKTHETQERSVRKNVRAMALDQFVRESNISNVDLIKIDTEGTENLVIEGGRSMIDEHKPILICETLFNKIEDKLEALMKEHGYQFFNHVRGKLHRVDTITRESDNGVTDCFFVHPKKLHLIHDYIAMEA